MGKVYMPICYLKSDEIFYHDFIRRKQKNIMVLKAVIDESISIKADVENSEI